MFRDLEVKITEVNITVFPLSYLLFESFKTYPIQTSKF